MGLIPSCINALISQEITYRIHRVQKFGMSLETLIPSYDLNNPQGYLKVAVLEGIMEGSLSLGLLLLEGQLPPT